MNYTKMCELLSSTDKYMRRYRTNVPWYVCGNPNLIPLPVLLCFFTYYPFLVGQKSQSICNIKIIIGTKKHTEVWRSRGRNVVWLTSTLQISWFTSDQFSHSVMSNYLWLCGLQHVRLPCPSPTPRAYLNSHPSNEWCHPTISSSSIPFSFHLQSFPASGSFPTNQFFASGSQSIGVSASTSVLPMNIQDWFPLGLTGLISLLSKGLSRVSPKPQFININSSVLNILYSTALRSIHDYWKNCSFDQTDLGWQSNVYAF